MMSSLPRHQRLRRTVGIAAFLGVAAVLLAVFARFESIRRATGREIASLSGPRDRLQVIADRLESQGRQAESDRRVLLNVLRLCRSAEDIPDLRGNRVVAHHQGLEKLCLYVPEGSHRLEISSIWKPAAIARPGVKLLTAVLRGVCHDEPYEIAFNVQLLSDTPACVSASNAQRLIILRADRLLQPYAGEGKYEIRIPDRSSTAPH